MRQINTLFFKKKIIVEVQTHYVALQNVPNLNDIKHTFIIMEIFWFNKQAIKLGNQLTAITFSNLIIYFMRKSLNHIIESALYDFKLKEFGQCQLEKQINDMICKK